MLQIAKWRKENVRKTYEGVGHYSGEMERSWSWT
jgi:hypothetical protein